MWKIFLTLKSNCSHISRFKCAEMWIKISISTFLPSQVVVWNSLNDNIKSLKCPRNFCKCFIKLIYYIIDIYFVIIILLYLHSQLIYIFVFFYSIELKSPLREHQ